MSDEDIWVWELMHDMKTFTINSEMQAYTKLFSSIIVVFLFDYLDAKWTARNVIQLKRKRRHEHTKKFSTTSSGRMSSLIYDERESCLWLAAPRTFQKFNTQEKEARVERRHGQLIIEHEKWADRLISKRNDGREASVFGSCEFFPPPPITRPWLHGSLFILTSTKWQWLDDRTARDVDGVGGRRAVRENAINNF